MALVLENTSRRDALIEIEQRYQKLWEEEKVFEQNVPNEEDALTLSSDELHKKYPKFLATMAYPYMNGVLHAGHAFTLSKAEFAVGFERMLGKRALFPLGFHCTGLPIKAAADKLSREIEMFGPNFDQNLGGEEPAEPASSKEEEASTNDPTKFKSNKSKAVAKQGGAKYQYEIMLQLGIPREEVHKFADATYFIKYFPPLAERDCRLMGARIDWRRSFVTTDYNPYYDSFVRWQMNAEYAKNKIKFGKRYTIFSPKDNQACMDHDRSSGEGVSPQEYVAIKILVEKAGPKANEEFREFATKNKVFLVAATLRPETMYGQRCCFVSSKIVYGVYRSLAKDEFFVCTERAYRNMCYQDLTPERGNTTPVMTISGAELFGSEIRAPLVEELLHVLPMETILPNKGTGVVTCVPSDSPDDFITVQDIRKKPEFYGVDPAWMPPATVPVLQTEKYGSELAKELVAQLKIQSPKEKDKLAEAKEIAYKEGFYNGRMIVGKYAGERVEDAKPKVRDDMVREGLAFLYSEPEKQVVSRSGDSCVVSLEDQWYSDYGEPTWREGTEAVLAQMNTYSPDVRNSFEGTLAWMKQWALSRTYGLGTRIPWDPQYLVESLSDSTVYMAYYTVAHLLHRDVDGHVPGDLGISASDLTDDFWNYVFTLTDDRSNISESISQQDLNRLRAEFRYFYPLDLRVSAKDLIGNHLTMCLYVHEALFPREYWPQSMRVNGHLLLNGDKMSKSTGNFLTLNQMLTKYGSDASRIALADAGDSTEDANLDESSANAAILRLHNLKEWLEYVLKEQAAKLRTGPLEFFDQAFNAEMDEIVLDTRAAYTQAAYRLALKRGLFDLQISRDYYRDVCQSLGRGLHIDLVKRFAEVQALLLTPIAPHFAEYVWRELLEKPGSVQNASFPDVKQFRLEQRGLIDAVNYVREVARATRETEGQLLKKKKKGPVFDPKKPAKLTVYAALQFPDWQQPYVDLIRSKVETKEFQEMAPDFKKEVGKLGDPKRGMQLVNTLRQLVLAEPEHSDAILDRKLTFDEPEVLKLAFDTLKLSAMTTNVTEVEVVVLDNGKGTDLLTGKPVYVPNSKIVSDAVPGKPGVSIVTIE